MIERLGSTSHIETVYGEPVTAAGVTVIPVARAEWGFGGGAGPRDEGSGGGGGARVRPVGYIEMRDGGTSFKPITDPARNVFLGVLAVALLLRAGRRR